MTKSTITREQLEEWVAQFDEDGGCDATDRQLEALIRQSLAAMDSEPVAYRWNYGGTTTWRLQDTKPTPGSNRIWPRVIEPLYRHAQPAPVVPEIDRKAIADKVYGKCSRIPGATFYNAAEFAIDEMEACRATMLAVAPQLPGSESATVPGKWIPVSERMPDVGVKVLCFPVKDEPIHATFNGQLWLQDVSWSGSDDTIDNVIPVSVTHWMPLPAAPQEVSHG
ncbi:TPA: DUF551 domain-containing protein [Klebsiella michiganensis]|nr:DUF551 domain-containing protein [Klebsiella michiganensis]